jgi:hypothetical protein
MTHSAMFVKLLMTAVDMVDHDGGVCADGGRRRRGEATRLHWIDKGPQPEDPVTIVRNRVNNNRQAIDKGPAQRTDRQIDRVSIS